MLAAWTVLWHPRLLSQTEQSPTWYRADSPPDPTIPRLITVPQPSIEMLPDRYEIRCEQVEGNRWVTGASRKEMLQTLQLDDPLPRLCGKHRSIEVDDFFAAGFTMLQIQVMTRRLRYTSNLDEIYLQGRIVAAAKAFIDGKADEAIDALHGFFDSLAEERDHYFASDPHLIDLTLLTPSTLTQLMQSSEVNVPAPPESANSASANSASANPASANSTSADESSLLATPHNVLIDAETADAIAEDPQRFGPLRDAVSSGRLGWAGGGPDPAVSLDIMTLAQAERAIDRAAEQTVNAIGAKPGVFARFAGSTPADLTASLVRNGYQGMISIDFAAGTGFGDEAKVIRSFGGSQIEALTAKPIDAYSDAAFLDLGPKLGEAIDSGEVATGLLAHWPDRVCQSFLDLRRAASWTLALGRFWKLDDYFRDGEHPYHHDTARAANGDSAQRLVEVVSTGGENPITAPAESFRDSIRQETRQRVRSMTAMVSGVAPNSVESSNLVESSNSGESSSSGEHSNSDQDSELYEAFAAASGATIDATGQAVMLVNPQDAATRRTISVPGRPPAAGDHIYAATPQGSGSGSPTADVTVDVTALGFAVAGGSPDGSGGQGSLLKKLFTKTKTLAGEASLQNEFMEISISPKTGGIQGVYSGATRGNRFSLRLAVQSSSIGDEDSVTMVCRELKTIESTPAVGTIESAGTVEDATGKTLCRFILRYSLRRGSRILEVTGTLSEITDLSGTPWQNYVALRAAVSTEAAICRVLLRDKVHRCSGRRLVAPLGVVIDEAERQTLVASGGLPFHRRVGSQFLDTLLVVRGEATREFTVHYGFDVPTPVPVAKSIIAPAREVSVAATSTLAPRGWIMHSSPKEVMINDVSVMQRDDGCLAVRLRLVQTRSKAATATIRLCRDVRFAIQTPSGSKPIDWNVPEPPPESDDETVDRDHSILKTDGESIRVPLSGHQVTDILAVLTKRS